MSVYRSMNNPIIKPSDVVPSRPDFEVIGVFNAGVAKLGDEVILLVRVAERPVNHDPEVYLAPVYDYTKDQLTIMKFDKNDSSVDFSDCRVIGTKERNYLTSLSHLRVARSRDGIHFTVEASPAIRPASLYDAYGIEDPRITFINDVYYINYSAASEVGIITYLVSTRDFNSFNRLGVIFHPDNKDVAIFPEKINGRYYALHRPSCSHYGKPEIWLAESPDLVSWGNHRHLMGVREESWENGRIGASAVPIKLEEGWLEIYHGADVNNRYCLGAVLLDKYEPWRVVAKSSEPIFEPETEYEVSGFFGNVVFSCGVLCEDGLVKLYYGASDTCIGYAEITLEYIFNKLGMKYSS